MITKYRAWDKDLEIMSYTGNNLILQISKNGIQIAYYDSFHEITNYELLQSTGLLDKNGKEIFEGDIVKDTNGYVGYIAFLKQEMGYVVAYKNYYKRLGHRYRLDDGHLEILGNIYEHSHLLGED